MKLAAPPTQAPLVDPKSETGLMTFDWGRWTWDLKRQVTIDTTDLPQPLVLGASPFVYQNTLLPNHDIHAIVKGGTVNLVEVSRDGVTYYDVGVIAGMIFLSWNDFMRITYAVVPTVTLIPR